MDLVPNITSLIFSVIVLIFGAVLKWVSGRVTKSMDAWKVENDERIKEIDVLKKSVETNERIYHDRIAMVEKGLAVESERTKGLTRLLEEETKTKTEIFDRLNTMQRDIQTITGILAEKKAKAER